MLVAALPSKRPMSVRYTSPRHIHKTPAQLKEETRELYKSYAIPRAELNFPESAVKWELTTGA
jgi:hypothetical protein